MLIILVIFLPLYCPSYSEQKKENEQAVYKKALKDWQAAIAEYEKKYPQSMKDVYDQKTIEGKKVYDTQAVFYKASNQLRSANYNQREEESLKAQAKYEAQQKKEKEEKSKKLEAAKAILEKQAHDKEKFATAAKFSQSTARSSQAFSRQPAQAVQKRDQQGKLESFAPLSPLNNSVGGGNLGRALPLTAAATAQQSAAQSAQSPSLSLTPRINDIDEEWDEAYSATDDPSAQVVAGDEFEDDNSSNNGDQDDADVDRDSEEIPNQNPVL